ncbi:MAG: GxxExxY protein [Candidatus Marinimicrobia bacterium]|nr:GxxExxY protein [Candidatus Neomarinimicrobiota bacterium]
MLFEEVSEKIIGAAFNVYNKMGFGYLEKVYENCMLIELSKVDDLDIKHQYPIKVEYEGEDVGDFVVDMLINDGIIVELKSVRHLLPIHEVQLVNYLKATGLELGLLINFGEQKAEIRRKVKNLKNR